MPGGEESIEKQNIVMLDDSVKVKKSISAKDGRDERE
jgi:hypothetical protein